MKKQYRPWSTSQSFLLPPSLLDWLPDGHLALFVLDVVEGMDLSAIESAIHAKDARGTRPYAPQMMLALLVYAYCVGVYSSRRIARACAEDIAFRVLSGNSQPHFTTINSFRKRHAPALAGLFVQVLQMCSRAGLVKMGHVALDGSKVQANASKHKAMSYGRMKSEQARLEQEVEELLARAEALDAEEDQKLGEGVDVEDIPAELKRRENRIARIKQAREELEAEARLSRAATLRERAAELREKATQPERKPGERKRSETCAAKNEREAEKLDPRLSRDTK